MTSTKYGTLFQLNYTKPLSPSASSAVALPGAQLYFYAANVPYSSTLQTVYGDSSLENALSNPVVADANGRFVPIYMNPALQYVVSLFNAAGTLLWQGSPANVPNPSQPIQLLADNPTSRSLTTALAIDPFLQQVLPGAGTYKVDMFLYLNAAVAGATPGIKFTVEYSGTLDPNAGNCLSIVGELNGATLTTAQSALAVNGAIITGSLSTTSATNFLAVSGTVKVTTAGTLALYWAQNVSSASSTYVLGSSSMSITQIG